MKTILESLKFARRDVPIANYVPYSALVNEHTIGTTGGEYVRIWKVRGISFETVDATDILTRHNGFNQFVRSLADGDVALWVHRIRRHVTDQFSVEYKNTFCQQLHDSYFDRICKNAMLVNELYVSMVYRPRTERLARWFEHSKKRTIDDIVHEQQRAVAAMDDLAARFESSLQPYGVEPLGEYAREGVRYSYALEFLAFLLNGVWEPIPLRKYDISEYLPSVRLFFGCENVEIRTPTLVRYGAILDIKEYPSFSQPGILNPILYDDYEYIETQSFSMLPKREAIASLKLKRNQLIASQDAGATQILELDQAIDHIIGGEFVMGEYHYSLVIFGETYKDVTKHVARARAVLQDAGFQTALIDIVPDGAWFAQLPGNWRYRPREAKITSRNFCGLTGLHNFDSGKRNGNPWGEAVTIMQTLNKQPYYFNFHASDQRQNSLDQKVPGNTLVIGQTGSGKTVLTLFLLSQALKYNPTVVYFDKDRGAEIALRAMGGLYFTLKYGEPTGLNPFQLPPTEANILFWESLVRQLVTHTSLPLTPREEEQISAAVRTVARMPRELRRLSTIRQNLLSTQTDGINARLKKWCWGEPLGWLFDNAFDRLRWDGHTIFGFDYTEFLDDPVTRTPLMMYLLYCTEGLIDGRRFMYFMAEFWKPLSDPVFSDFAKNKQKTIRKQNGFGVFDTQSPADILSSNVARTMVEQTATMILMPNPRADRNDYVDGLKLSEAEFEIVRSLGEHSRQFLVKQGQRSTIAQLDLGGFNDVLSVLSSTTDNVILVEQLIAQVGENPDLWLPIFWQATQSRRATTS
ncbi:VirB4 family type IV secretion/conjugal transfer ATPase [Burkholderia territorii]|uniref:VirB4 family type IV secretion/conjugal transfer ATPase n=1 Tax=Burkholderia territorii TaxID=1503055 RepID=UPI000752B850|nr:VirB4 family type IV secretion/conjugal transfer ATPase [Burkholderia territorii]KWE37923.1 type IV secretion system protein VirB4 [Burkholderia territorii]KWE38263.1 type IV secretion system protein VirB4 [Burkholderia territorii]KWE42907.1 type IV secretion system protein VirB4 [Burkholderia territorii]